MSHSEQAFSSPSLSFSLWEKTCKKLFLTALNVLPEGFLVIKERGEIVAELGNSSDELRAEVNIIEASAYPKLMFGGSVASGETYTAKLWETPDLTNVIRVFARNLPTLDRWESRFRWLSMPANKLKHLANRNSKIQAKRNIGAHYDLGNRLYTKFLDNSMMYSSAIYPDANSSLAEAQQHKLHTICEKLQLKPSDQLVEIGTGWGGLAVYAAENFGCHVTTTTISDEQYDFAKELIEKKGLTDKITLLKRDYRLLSGKFDKLVSIEMIEAVGKEYLPEFFKKCASLLKPEGLMVLQSIIIDDRRYDSYSNSVDFIQKHIFPGGFLPSQLVINKHVKKHTDFSIRDVHDIGLDYAKTLRDWYLTFSRQASALEKDGYDERFMRMWKYYLNYCEGGFLERTISTVQLVMSKPNYLGSINR